MSLLPSQPHSLPLPHTPHIDDVLARHADLDDEGERLLQLVTDIEGLSKGLEEQVQVCAGGGGDR